MSPLATVGILSIGEMGMGIAKLLVAHNFRVVTNLEGRSKDTHTRAQSASIEILPTDLSLVKASDYILSIVPPRDALATATRITSAFNSLPAPKSHPLFYLDFNAISPRSARAIADLFAEKALGVHFLDGGIIGGAPSLKIKDGEKVTTTLSIHPPSSPDQSWNLPSIPISGPLPSSLPLSFHLLSEALNLNHISPEIGIASGLKCCFATTTKGIIALCIQAFTTAENLGVLPLLLKEMEGRIPGLLKSGKGGVIGMPPKAYRWVREMEEINEAHNLDGGFPPSGKGLFAEVAKIYKTVAEDTVLGGEKTERRKRGRSIEDVAAAIGEGLREKRKKVE